MLGVVTSFFGSSKLTVILAVVIAILCGSGYLYFKYNQSKIEALNLQNGQLRTAVQTQEETITAQRTAIERQNSAMEELQTRSSEAEERRRELENELRARNLETQALTNRSETEATINRETQQLFRSIESVTSPNRARVRPVTPPAQGTQR